MDMLEIDKENQTYTKQTCEKCGKSIIRGFGFALMNIDEKVLCEDCKVN